jgi:hypothetical protein
LLFWGVNILTGETASQIYLVFKHTTERVSISQIGSDQMCTFQNTLLSLEVKFSFLISMDKKCKTKNCQQLNVLLNYKL